MAAVNLPSERTGGFCAFSDGRLQVEGRVLLAHDLGTAPSTLCLHPASDYQAAGHNNLGCAQSVIIFLYYMHEDS